MSDKKGETNETKTRQQAKNTGQWDTALLSDILPLPKPRSQGRIGNTYADSKSAFEKSSS